MLEREDLSEGDRVECGRGFQAGRSQEWKYRGPVCRTKTSKPI